MTPRREIAWYFDVISPFAYLALPRVLALAETRPVAMRPVLFGALLAKWGQLGPAEIAPKRLQTYRMVQFQAAQSGLRFRFPPRHPFRSLDAMRLLTALDAPVQAVRIVFDFVWGEGRDPGAERDALATRLGIADADALLARSGAKDRLRFATEDAAEAGVFGVPTLAIGRELFWGADAMPMAEAFLADPDLFNSPEMARLKALPVGVERSRK
jgi:2-hydroxychromene-2-carboxylate isomerase